MATSPIDPQADMFDVVGRGLQHHGLRRANERAVLTVIGFNPGVSNADIARLSGLAPQTVSAILADIDSAGLITRGEVLRGRRGQPATPISLRREGAYSIGVEIGWRHVSVLLINLQAEILYHERRSYDFPDARTLFDDIAKMVEGLASRLPAGHRARLEDLGLAIPTNLGKYLSLVDAPAEQHALWIDLDPIAELARRTGLHVSQFNDGNAACWAELIAFPRPRPGNFIYFLISHFTAAGIVGEGTLWEGPTGNSANLGSMLVNGPDGRLQPVHSIASISALASRLKSAGHDVDERNPSNWQWDSFGDVLENWIADSAVALARVVFNTTTVIETGLVVIDGIVRAEVVQRLVDRLKAELQDLPIAAYEPPQVVAGHSGATAPALGAAELILYRRFLSRSLVDLVG